MAMTYSQMIIMIILAACGTMVTRFLPFLFFPENKPVPRFIQFLGDVLPLSVMGMLVVYALRNTPITSGSHGVPELIALLVLCVVHVKWRNMLLSIATGTLTYMAIIYILPMIL